MTTFGSLCLSLSVGAHFPEGDKANEWLVCAEGLKPRFFPPSLPPASRRQVPNDLRSILTLFNYSSVYMGRGRERLHLSRQSHASTDRHLTLLD